MMNVNLSRFCFILTCLLLTGCQPGNHEKGIKTVGDENTELPRPPQIVEYDQELESYKDTLTFNLDFIKAVERIEISRDSIDWASINSDAPMSINMKFGRKLEYEYLIEIDMAATWVPIWFDLYKKSNDNFLFNIVTFSSTVATDSIHFIKENDAFLVKKATRTLHSNRAIDYSCPIKVIQNKNKINLKVFEGEGECIEYKVKN